MALFVCGDCGNKVSDMAKACPYCGRPVSSLETIRTWANNPPSFIPRNSPVTAAAFSFLWPGLGQLYNGQVGKGLWLGLIQYVLLKLFLATAGGLPFLILTSAWLCGMWDAYSGAKKIRDAAIKSE